VHSNPSATVFWYLNNIYIATTKNIHEVEIEPSSGAYKLTALDEFGNEIHRDIQIEN